MKILHLSDLHLTKQVLMHSMRDLQTEALEKTISFIKEKAVDCVIIAGDVFDSKNVPNEAIDIFEGFLHRLSDLSVKVLVISGNHDDSTKLSFASNFLKKSALYFAKPYGGKISKVTLNDEFGEIDFYLLPYISPRQVLDVHEDFKIQNNDDKFSEAIQFVLNKQDIDYKRRCVLVAHQFVSGAQKDNSEQMIIGGSEEIPYTLFENFDYVALGHIHRAQKIKKETIRYCGTLVNFSKSEAKHQKQLCLVDFKQKGDIKIETSPLILSRQMREIKGTLEELLSHDAKERNDPNDYYYIELSDDKTRLNAFKELSSHYKNIMEISYSFILRAQNKLMNSAISEIRSPIELFSQLFKSNFDREMNEKEISAFNQVLEEVENESTKA